MLAVAHAREYEIEVGPIFPGEEFGLGDFRPLLAQCVDDNRRQGDLGPRGCGFNFVKIALDLLIIFKNPLKSPFSAIFGDPEDAIHRIDHFVPVGRV